MAIPPKKFPAIYRHLAMALALASPWCGSMRAADEKPAAVQAVRRVRVIGGNGMVFFGNDDDDDADQDAGKSPLPDPAGPQVLEFADGNRLHGTLVTINTDPAQLSWQRADASAPLAFPLADVAHLALDAGTKPESKLHATVKLTGGDWLAADVTGVAEKKIQLTLGDGSVCAVAREKVEWIYFSKNSAPECYDGPTSLAGWISGGGWDFSNGALRAKIPAAIGRPFEALPDQAEYFLEVDQGAAGHAFMFMLHTNNVTSRVRDVGTIQLMFRGSELRMWKQSENQMKAEQTDLTKLLPGLSNDAGGEKKPVQFRVLEDYPGGRLVVFINGIKVADWTMDKGKAGQSRGGVSFQPQGWNPDSEQVITQFRVLPWDGRVPTDGVPGQTAENADLVSLADGEAKGGTIESLNGEHVKLHTENGAVEVPRAKIVMLRFRRAEHPPDEDPPVAHVRLTQRGEFDVASLSARQGHFTMRTNFGGELTLSAAAVGGIDLARAPWSPPKPADELVFQNGDRLRGTLQGAGTGHKVQWRSTHVEAPVEFDTAGMAGVALAAAANQPEAKFGVVARLRNGDTLGGALVKFDAGNLVLDSAPAGQFALASDQVQALYFSTGNKLPVLDGAARRDAWTGIESDANGMVEQVEGKKADPAKPAPPSAWRSFDGAFTYSPSDAGRTNSARAGSLRLTPDFNAMPQLVEMTFDVAVSKLNVAFSGQLFFDQNNPGYYLQVYASGLYIYDMGARQQFRAGGQQQLQFGDKVKPKARQRHIRLLTDRRSGKLTILVDGVVIGQVNPKAGSPPRNLGRNVQLTSATPGGCTFSNLWIGPWNGQPPDFAPAADAPPHTVLLANGDETHGTVGSITAEVAKMDSEAGAIELPVERLTAIDFGGPPAAHPAGVHLRLADWGALTVKSFRVEKEEIVGQSELMGEFKVPRSAVREIVFASPAAEKPKGEGGKKSEH